MNIKEPVNTETITLSIRFASDGFCFYLAEDAGKGTVQRYGFDIDPSISMGANAMNLFAERLQPLAGKRFKAVNVVHDTRRVTFMPFAIFDDEDKDFVFHACFDKRHNENICYNISARAGCVSLFAADKHVVELVGDAFPKARHYCSAFPLLEHCVNMSGERVGKNVYALVSDSRLFLFVIEKGNLLFANVFDCDTDADRLYYVMGAWNATACDSTNDALHVACDACVPSGLKRSAGRYIRNVFEIERHRLLDTTAEADGGRLTFDMESLILENS